MPLGLSRPARLASGAVLVALLLPATAVAVPVTDTSVTRVQSRAEAGPAATAGTINKVVRVTSKRRADGASRVVATIKFRSWNRVSVKGRVNDLCPGDGNWAIAWFEAHLPTGNSEREVRADKGGCESTPAKFTFTFDTRRAIKWVSVKSCVSRANTHPTDLVAAENCRTHNIRNPKAGRR